jgi:HK97 family phage major capsid protein
MTLIEKLQESRAAKMDEIDAIIAAAESEERDATDEEFAKSKTLGTEVDALDERIAELAAQEARREKAIDADKSGDKRTERKVETVREPRTYTAKADGPQMFSDAYRAQFLGDGAARERLTRHIAETQIEARDVGSSNVGGLVVPQYLVDDFAAILRAGRVTANVVRHEPLPPQGTALVVPRGNTGTTVAAQATQNSAVSNTDLDFNSDLTVNVKTFAGQQNVSRQTLERGTPGIDRLVYGDLVADYAKKLDTSIISDDGTSGTHKGLLSASGTNGVTYTQASPTAANFWPKLADAVQRVGGNRFLPADAILMHPRRWGWMLSQVDGNNRPLVISYAGFNPMGTGASGFSEGAVGSLLGINVYVDANIPTNLGAGTNEDRVFVIRAADPILWEDGDGMPRELRFGEARGLRLLGLHGRALRQGRFDHQRNRSGHADLLGRQQPWIAGDFGPPRIPNWRTGMPENIERIIEGLKTELDFATRSGDKKYAAAVQAQLDAHTKPDADAPAADGEVKADAEADADAGAD